MAKSDKYYPYKNIWTLTDELKKENSELIISKSREDIFFEIINYLNENSLQGSRILYDCGNLGFIIVYWHGNRWNMEWFDKAEKWI